MAIKKVSVEFSRIYIVEVDENSSNEFIIKKARSEFNNDMQFGLTNALEDNFYGEIIENPYD